MNNKGTDQTAGMLFTNTDDRFSLVKAHSILGPMFHFWKASSSVNCTRHLSITKSHKYSGGIFNFGIGKSVMGEVNMMFILTRSGY